MCVLPTHNQADPLHAAETYRHTRLFQTARSSMVHIHTWLAFSMRKASYTCSCNLSVQWEETKIQIKIKNKLERMPCHWFYFPTFFCFHVFRLFLVWAKKKMSLSVLAVGEGRHHHSVLTAALIPPTTLVNGTTVRCSGQVTQCSASLPAAESVKTTSPDSGEYSRSKELYFPSKIEQS